MAKAVSQQTECPVAALALRVGDLWFAHAQAEENEHDKGRAQNSDDIPQQITELRIATEQLASFERAKSLAGALFHLALAHETAHSICEEFPGESGSVDSLFRKLNRLLESAAMVLKDELGEGYEPYKEVVSTYIDIEADGEHRMLRPIENIPAMADEYRQSKKASA